MLSNQTDALVLICFSLVFYNVYILCLLGVNNFEVIQARAFNNQSTFYIEFTVVCISLKMIKIGRNMSEI